MQIPLILRGIFFGSGRLLVEDVGWLVMGLMVGLLFMDGFLSVEWMGVRVCMF